MMSDHKSPPDPAFSTVTRELQISHGRMFTAQELGNAANQGFSLSPQDPTVKYLPVHHCRLHAVSFDEMTESGLGNKRGHSNQSSILVPQTSSF
jgi:hypothetical protein